MNVILRLIIKYPLLGFLFTKYKNSDDILNFAFAGRFSKVLKNMIYLLLAMLYFTYLFLSVYMIRNIRKNDCYILKNVERKIEYPEKVVEINKNIKKDIITFNAIYFKNMILICITLILFIINSDTLIDFVALFMKKGGDHLSRISKLLPIEKC